MSRGAWERPYTNDDQIMDEDAMWTVDDLPEGEEEPTTRRVPAIGTPLYMSPEQQHREACDCDGALFGGPCMVIPAVLDPARVSR